MVKIPVLTSTNVAECSGAKLVKWINSLQLLEDKISSVKELDDAVFFVLFLHRAFPGIYTLWLYSGLEIVDSHCLNRPITIRVWVLRNKFSFCHWSIQIMRTNDFEPWLCVLWLESLCLGSVNPRMLNYKCSFTHQKIENFNVLNRGLIKLKVAKKVDYSDIVNHNNYKDL